MEWEGEGNQREGEEGEESRVRYFTIYHSFTRRVRTISYLYLNHSFLVPILQESLYSCVFV
jgi:hypothetical protein